MGRNSVSENNLQQKRERKIEHKGDHMNKTKLEMEVGGVNLVKSMQKSKKGFGTKRPGLFKSIKEEGFLNPTFGEHLEGQ